MEKRKDFYLITSVFFLYPYMGGLMVKISLQMTFLWRKFKIMCR